MEHPLVIQESNPTQRELLSEIIGSTYRGDIHTFELLDDCQQFVDQQRVDGVFLELQPGNDQLVQWVRSVPDMVFGFVDWDWTEQQLRPYVDAGLDDYLFKPYQPDRIVRLIDNRVKAKKRAID